MSEHHHEHEHEHHHEHEHEHHHEHEHEHHHEHSSSKWDYIKIGISAVFLGLSFIPAIGNFRIALSIFCIISAALSGAEIFEEGIKEIIHKQIGEHFLLLISVAAAFFIGEFREGAAVAVLFALGEILEGLAEAKSEKSIRALSEIRSDTANLTDENGNYVTVRSEEIKIGDIITVLPHERIPVDCRIITGSSTVDTSAVTGESMPVQVEKNDCLLAGEMNKEGSFTAVVLKSVSDSAASRIIELAKNSLSQKGRSENFITKFAKYYTPAVVIIGVLIAVIPSIITKDWTKWVKSGLVFLVASCPCALVISVPLAFFSGMGLASKNGVIIKGGKFIEKLAKVRAAAFDKTGTLTENDFTVTSFECFGDFKEEEIKKYTSVSEKSSAHPLAKALTEFCGEWDCVPENLREIPGMGVTAEADGKKIICGGEKLLKENNIALPDGCEYTVYIAIDSVVAGGFRAEGKIRDESADTIGNLRRLGIDKIFMLTGDRKSSAEYVAKQCGLDGCFSDLLPEDKAQKLKELQEEFGSTVYVGDGVNDAPVLVESDVGVSMGLGSDAALEISDAVLAGNRLSDLCKAVKISKKTMRAVYFNIIFSLVIKLAVLIPSLFGYAFMSLAVLADVGVSIVAIINSSRLLAGKIK